MGSDLLLDQVLRSAYQALHYTVTHSHFQVEALLSLIRTNTELEDQGKPVKNLCLNRVFIGNPGTGESPQVLIDGPPLTLNPHIFHTHSMLSCNVGKTTVAQIYGHILKDLGLLSKGDVIVKNPSDFMGGVLGESEQKTVAILDAAVGSVLVIDEAYGLFSSGTSGFKDPYKV